jgi:hypothetical protein
MSLKFGIALLMMALFGAPIGYVAYHEIQHESGPASWGGGGTVHGAPGPIAGAGLPILAVGFGAYWLVRRYRRKPDKAAS